MAAEMIDILLTHQIYVHLCLAVMLINFGLILMQRSLNSMRREWRRSSASGPLDSAAADFLFGPVDHPEASPVMAGSLRSTSMASLLQFLHAEKKTGRLVIHSDRGAEQASLIIRNGTIEDARSGRRRGEEALSPVLAMTEGSFSLSGTLPEKFKKTVHQPTMALLLDQSRILDEQISRPGKPEAPPPSERPGSPG
jgi:predicted HAD superfamily Cof-like phosphohydrolase